MRMKHESNYMRRWRTSGFLLHGKRLSISIYFYSDTREGSFAQEALQGFQGVLVSDFYTAYDSIACALQKCILHLIRDLNDAVLDNPFDESVKGIVTTFADLLGRLS
jgi:hypothetical protein